MDIILTTHIISMTSSLVLMVSAISLGVFGKKTAVDVASAGMIAVTLGAFSGFALLIGSPLSIQCAALTLYLVAFTGLYYFGFGFGREEKATFVRNIMN